MKDACAGQEYRFTVLFVGGVAAALCEGQPVPVGSTAGLELRDPCGGSVHRKSHPGGAISVPGFSGFPAIGGLLTVMHLSKRT